MHTSVSGHTQNSPGTRVLSVPYVVTRDRLGKGPNVLRALVESVTDLITGSNDRGDYLGTAKNRNFYAGHNKAVAMEIYPNNVHKHEGQFATFAILAAKGDGKDPICIVDLGLGRPNVSR